MPLDLLQDVQTVVGHIDVQEDNATFRILQNFVYLRHVTQ